MASVVDVNATTLSDSENHTDLLPISPSNTCDLYNFVIDSVCIGSICIIGTICNLISLYIFGRGIVKTSTTYQLVWLAIVDTTLLATLFPMYAIGDWINYFQISDVYYQIVWSYVAVYILPCSFIAQTGTIWLTVFIGISRYLALCRPFSGLNLNCKKHGQKYIILILILSILYNIPHFLATYIHTHQDENGRVYTVPQYTEIGYSKVYTFGYKIISYSILILCLPLTILIFITIRILIELRENARVRRTLQSSQQENSQNNITAILVTIVIILIICQLPSVINQILWKALDRKSRQCGGFQFYFRRISNLFVTVNSAANFFIYFSLNKRFRYALFTHTCRTRSRSNATEMTRV